MGDYGDGECTRALEALREINCAQQARLEDEERGRTASPGSPDFFKRIAKENRQRHRRASERSARCIKHPYQQSYERRGGRKRVCDFTYREGDQCQAWPTVRRRARQP